MLDRDLTLPVSLVFLLSSLVLVLVPMALFLKVHLMAPSAPTLLFAPSATVLHLFIVSLLLGSHLVLFSTPTTLLLFFLTRLLVCTPVDKKIANFHYILDDVVLNCKFLIERVLDEIYKLSLMQKKIETFFDAIQPLYFLPFEICKRHIFYAIYQKKIVQLYH